MLCCFVVFVFTFVVCSGSVFRLVCVSGVMLLCCVCFGFGVV